MKKRIKIDRGLIDAISLDVLSRVTRFYLPLISIH